MHWRIRGRRSWGTTFCGGTNSAKGLKEGKCCCKGRTTIHKSVVKSTTSHRGANNGRSIVKGDGDGAMWNGSSSEEKMRNPRQSYTYGERY